MINKIAQRSPIQIMEQLCATLHAQGEVIHPHPTEKLAEITKKHRRPIY